MTKFKSLSCIAALALHALSGDIVYTASVPGVRVELVSHHGAKRLMLRLGEIPFLFTWTSPLTRPVAPVTRNSGPTAAKPGEAIVERQARS